MFRVRLRKSCRDTFRFESIAWTLSDSLQRHDHGGTCGAHHNAIQREQTQTTNNSRLAYPQAPLTGDRADTGAAAKQQCRPPDHSGWPLALIACSLGFGKYVGELETLTWTPAWPSPAAEQFKLGALFAPHGIQPSQCSGDNKRRLRVVHMEKGEPVVPRIRQGLVHVPPSR